jgi:hypothetical protein
MSEDSPFPSNLKLDREKESEHTWGEYHSCAERVLYGIDRLSKFKSPQAQGFARLWNKLLNGDYEDFKGVIVTEYESDQMVKHGGENRNVMGVALYGDNHGNQEVYALAHVPNVNKLDDDYLLFALAEEASHIRDLMKVKNTEGKFRWLNKDEERETEVLARLRRVELYKELKQEGVRNSEMEYLAKAIEPRRRLFGKSESDDERQKREYQTMLKIIRETGYDL